MGKRVLRGILFCGLVSFLACGCSSRTGWSKAQIEAKVKDAAKLKEIHLQETGKGEYEGTGTGEDGTTYKIKATYTHSQGEGKERSDLHWVAEDPKGVRRECKVFEGTDGEQGFQGTVYGPEKKKGQAKGEMKE
jgi:hypothetical protein